MNQMKDKGWNCVPIPKIVLAGEIFRTYYRDRQPGQLNAKELTADLIEEILRHEAHDLSVKSVGFCLSESPVVDWDFVAFSKKLTDATIIEVHKRTLEACREIPRLLFNAEFIAVVLQLHEDAAIDEFLKDNGAHYEE